tara:strand:- start:265 stop:453 length:189 start_codon:yes stop_codon:yes gene_type:complete
MILRYSGTGKLEDFYKVLNLPKASGSAAGSKFHFTEITPKMVKDFLKSKKILVRDMFAEQIV